MEVTIPISNTARRFGYVIWPRKYDDAVRKLLGAADTIEVVFDGQRLGQRRVSWRYRRISIGSSRTKGADPGSETFRLVMSSPEVLSVTME